MTIHIHIFLIQLRCLFFADEAEAPNKIVYADWLNNNYGYLDGGPLPGQCETTGYRSRANNKPLQHSHVRGFFFSSTAF